MKTALNFLIVLYVVILAVLLLTPEPATPAPPAPATRHTLSNGDDSFYNDGRRPDFAALAGCG